MRAEGGTVDSGVLVHILNMLQPLVDLVNGSDLACDTSQLRLVDLVETSQMLRGRVHLHLILDGALTEGAPVLLHSNPLISHLLRKLAQSAELRGGIG